MSPTPSDALRDEAYRRYQAGDSATAAQLCRQLLQQQPQCAEAVYLLGVMAQDAGQWEQACNLYCQAAALAPDNAVFPNTLGEAYFTLSRPTEALACFRQAVALRPTYERTHNNLGRLLNAQGDLAAARASFEEAVRLNPRYTIAHNNLGALLLVQGQLDAAADHLRLALTLRPDYPEAHFNLGATLQAQGDPVAAAECFREAIRLRPHYVRAHFHLGQVLERQTHWPEALACYETAVRLQPDDAEMLRRLGDLLMLKKDWPAALAALVRAAELQPGKPEPFARLVDARLQVCDWRTYTANLDRLWADAEKQLATGEATAVVPFQALTLPWPGQRLLAVARSHADVLVRQQRERGQALDFRHSRTRTGRLRVGYLSGDFYDHPISHLLQGLFGRHDRDHFEVFAYSFGLQDHSAYRQRIERDCEHFVDVADLSLPATAQRIAADGIHILVDLMGHTGYNRLAALALRPAPVQVTYLGHAGTTGADFIDYLIGDPVVTPPDLAAAFREQLVRLPHCYLATDDQQTIADSAGTRPDHGLPEVGLVFCAFNKSYKIEPRVLGAWMRILSEVPGSVLWLSQAGPLVEENLRREAEARGVEGGRLVFSRWVRGKAEHLARHRLADLFLDTLIYNGHTTAYDALWAGLPVLTCPGDTFASRVGASLLHAVGLPELIAPDLEEYERHAVELARQPEKLRQLGEKLAAQRPTAPLFDTPRFVRNLERAYLNMWDNYAAGRSPQAMDVTEPGEPIG